MIQIDGSYGEGGGQMLRTAGALSILTGKPFHIKNIRKNRPTPGLRVQHLKTIMACADMCNAKLENAKIGSKEIVFEPGTFIDEDNLEIHLETAASISLSMQMLAPAVLKSGKRFRVDYKGGAVFGKFAPPLHYTKNVLFPVLRKMGYNISADIIKYGFYPNGGARVVSIFETPSLPLKPIKMIHAPAPEIIRGISISTRELKNAKVSERTRAGAMGFLKSKGFDSEIKTEYCEADNTGCGIVLSVKSYPISAIGSDGLGAPGLKAELLGKYTARTLVDFINSACPVDTHMSDQLLIFMALAKGKSSIKTPSITEHAKTNMFLIQNFLETEFIVEEDENGFIVSCEGIGFKNQE